MPIYCFKCGHCGQRGEKYTNRMDAGEGPECCGEPMRRSFSDESAVVITDWPTSQATWRTPKKIREKYQRQREEGGP